MVFAHAVGTSAFADAPTNGLLVVTTDYLDRGVSFTILGSRLDPGATVTFRLDTATSSHVLGGAQVAQDGLLQASFATPADIPLGDAWLRGRTSTGEDLELYVHVGPRAESPGAQATGTALLDEPAIGRLLSVVGAALLVLAAAWYVRGRRRIDR